MEYLNANLLSFMGITVSAAFGAWGIYLTVKNRRIVRLTFFKDQAIALFDTIVKNLPELEVLYKSNPVTPNLVLLRGSIINTGKKDISPHMVEESLSAVLPEGFKWLTAKVVSTSENVQASIHMVDDYCIQIKTSLLHCQEYVRVQALAEVPIELPEANESLDESLMDSISFSHRIEDAGIIAKVELIEEESAKKRLRSISITNR